jgi:hypothetical protein
LDSSWEVLEMSASKFAATKKSNPCPVCDRIDGKCRTLSDDPVVLCGHTQQGHEPSGWKYVKPAKNPVWSVFALDDGQSTQSWQDRLEARNKRNAARESEKAERAAKLKPVTQRDAEYRAHPKTLSTARYQGLKARGLTDAEIQFAIDQHWLWDFPGRKGFAIAALSVDGLIQGCQIANDNRDPKYIWHSKDGSGHIPETGEMPLFIWIHPDADRSALRLNGCEGGLKSLVAALKHWRAGDIQTAFVGAAGGHFGEKSLTALLKSVGIKSLSFAPDAGAVENPSLMASYEGFFKTCWNLGYKPTVRWWGQYSKPGRDLDELDGTENVRKLSGAQFLDLAKWWALKKFTPDQVVAGEFCNFPTPQAGQLLAIKAGLGAGKTHRSIEILKQLDRGAIVLTPTNNLGKNFVGRATRAGLKYVYHLQSEAGRSMLRDKSASFVLCPDSIIHLDDPATFAGRIVIVDEAMQNWVAFLQRPTAIKNYRTAAIEALKQGLAAAYAIILLDGNLTDRGCEWWAEFAEKTVVKVAHHKPDAAAFDVRFMDAPDPAKLFEVMQSLALSNVTGIENHPFAFVTDSKRDAVAAHARFEALGLKGYCLSSDTDDEPWVAEFLSDTDGFIDRERPDYLILSPSGGSGLDINIRGYFSYVFQLGRGVNLCDDLSQHIARIRDPQAKRIIWVATVGLPAGNPITETSEQQIHAAIAEYYTADITSAMGEKSGRAALLQLRDSLDALFKPQAPLIAAQNLETKHLRALYREMLITAGHAVKSGEAKAKSKSAQSEQADMKLTHRMNHARAIEAAETLTDQEAAKLQEKSGLNLQERTLIARWYLLNALPGIETSEEWQDCSQVKINAAGRTDEARYKFIDDLIESRMISKARSFWMWQNPESAKLIQRDRWQKLLGGEEFKRLKSTELYLETLRRCGLEAVLNCDVISKDLPCVQNFLQNCRKKANRLKLGLSTKALNNSRLLSDLIEPLGLVLFEAEKHNGRSERRYRIESEIPQSVVDAIGVKMTEKIEKINAEKVDSADRQNADSESVRGATGHTDFSYKERSQTCSNQADQNSTVEAPPHGWMDEESLEDIRALWSAADTDEARAALRQLIPPDALESAIAS